LDKEKEWRINSRAMWIEPCHHNTKYSLNFSRYRRKRNTIWELKNRDANKVWRFHDLKNIGVHHLNEIFEEPDRKNLPKILKFVSYFPRFVNEENNFLYEPVTKRNLCLYLVLSEG